MANSYVAMTYGIFRKQTEQDKKTEKVSKFCPYIVDEFREDWNRACDRLRNSGADLSKILIVKGRE